MVAERLGSPGRGLARELALAVAWGVLCYLIAFIHIQLPGTKSVAMDVAQTAVVASVFFLRRPWLTLLPALGLTLNMTPGADLAENFATTFVMNAVAGPIAWYVHRALERRNLAHVPLALSWAAFIGLYYTVLLVPLMVLTNIAFLGYPPEKALDAYVSVVDGFAYEMLLTALVTSFAFVSKEELARRARAEERLSAALEAQRALLAATPVAVIGVTADGRVSAWNEAAERMLGRASPAAAGAEPLAEVLAGRHVRRTETKVVAADGADIPVAVTGAPLGEGRGGGVLIVEDLREQLAMRETLRRSAAMTALGGLVGGLAHELRNPVFGISATLDAFGPHLANDPRLERMQRTLRGQAEHLDALTSDLLTYGKVGLGERTPGSLELPLHHALVDCAAQAATAGVSLEVAMAPGLPWVALDASQLHRVFRNLLQNALAFAPRGGVVQVEGVAAAYGDGPGVRIDVLDRGRGFAAEDLPHVFEPFFTRRPGGTGLGMSSVQRIVELHGGTVEASNRADGGARVTVRLPAVGADPATRPA
ncbi:MAG: ATP-binding protein [Myxococcota bacterium]